MGFNISKGFILKTSNSAKVDKVNAQLRVIFTELLRKHACKKMAQTVSKLSSVYSNPKLEKNIANDNIFDILSKEIFYIKSEPVKTLYTHYVKNEDTIFEAVKNTYKLFTRYDLEGRDYNYANNHIYFKSQKKHTVYIMAFDQEIVDDFNVINEELKILEDFSYETYCTDDLTRTEYRFRDKVWSSLFKKSSMSKEVMNGISVDVDFFNIDAEDIVPFLYSELKRLEIIFKSLRRNELYIELLLKTGKDKSELAIHELTGLTMDAEDIVQEELLKGDKILLPEYIERVPNDNDFYELIFTKKYPAFKELND
jgi:hypothetical protein